MQTRGFRQISGIERRRPKYAVRRFRRSVISPRSAGNKRFTTVLCFPSTVEQLFSCRFLYDRFVSANESEVETVLEDFTVRQKPAELNRTQKFGGGGDASSGERNGIYIPPGTEKNPKTVRDPANFLLRSGKFYVLKGKLLRPRLLMALCNFSMELERPWRRTRAPYKLKAFHISRRNKD